MGDDLSVFYGGRGSGDGWIGGFDGVGHEIEGESFEC